MAQGKRKSDVLESDISSEKYPKNASNILHLTDDHCLEKDYQNLFRTMADQLINHHELVVMEEHCFRLCEIEFYFYHSTRHSDTFAHRHPEQEHHSHWYFHRQGTSTTANYKAGTYKGLDITFSSITGSSFGGILLRSIENKQTGQVYEGSCLVVDALLNLTKSENIKELVEIKLKKNLDIFNSNPILYLRSIRPTNSHELLASPRVGLTLKVPSIDRERFLFRPYRFTPKDYYPSKMKMTILLSLAAEKSLSNPQKKLSDYADEISKETNTRLSTVKTNLNDCQKGYEIDTSKKTSPLVDFYKKNFSTGDLAKAYGIWLRIYRTS